MLSDFGLKDNYVAEMKAVILSINPQATVVDITHKVEKFNIRMGAFVLASTAHYFPPNTVHVAVVDPGVGTRRRPIIVETKQGLYVGPDNGLLMLAAQKEGIIEVYHIVNPEYMLSRVSRTFHGRDIFAPVAAHLASGTRPSEVGPAIQDYVFPQFVRPQASKREVFGEVIYVDDFGNVISNVSAEDVQSAGIHEGDYLLVRLGGKTLTLKFCSAYGEVPTGTALAIVGSSNFLEVAINQRSASKSFEAKVGDSFSISVVASN